MHILILLTTSSIEQYQPLVAEITYTKEVQEGIPKILFPKITFAKVAKVSLTKTYGEVHFLAELQYRSLSYKTCSNN